MSFSFPLARCVGLFAHVGYESAPVCLCWPRSGEVPEFLPLSVVNHGLMLTGTLVAPLAWRRVSPGCVLWFGFPSCHVLMLSH